MLIQDMKLNLENKFSPKCVLSEEQLNGIIVYIRTTESCKEWLILLPKQMFDMCKIAVPVLR